VVADPAVGSVAVDVSGVRVLDAWFVASSDVVAAPGWAEVEAPATFCRSLLERLSS
jgi:hypothetical protein